MSLIKAGHAYMFLAGLYIGGHTNIFSNLVITGLLTYIVNPELYTKDRLDRVKSFLWSKINGITGIEEIIIKTPEETYQDLKTPNSSPEKILKLSTNSNIIKLPLKN